LILTLRPIETFPNCVGFSPNFSMKFLIPKGTQIDPEILVPSILTLPKLSLIQKTGANIFIAILMQLFLPSWAVQVQELVLWPPPSTPSFPPLPSTPSAPASLTSPSPGTEKFYDLLSIHN